jgi:HlyD family secretion protein
MKKHTFILLLLPLFAACGVQEEAPLQPVVNVAVKVAKVETADVKLIVQAPASVFAREQSNISSRLTAPIRKLFVRKGDNVVAGQVLAQLDNRDLMAQCDEAAAAVTDADANLQRVSSGTLPTDIERARGQSVSAEAVLNLAQKIYDRRRQLFDQGAIPQRDLLVSQNELAQANTTAEVAKKSLDLLQNQSRDKDIRIAKSKVEQAQAHLSFVKAQLEFTEIRSVSTGTITEQFMFPGDMAKPDAPIFTIMDLSIAVARAQIPESEAAAVRTGQSCTFVPSDDKRVSFNGHVAMVNQAVDTARRTIEAWCEIQNPKRALRSGTFGQATFVTGIAPRSFVIPLTAVQFIEGTKKGFVMIAGEKGKALKKEVEIGEVFEGKAQIKTGIAAGDSVIVQGAYGLPDDTQIHVQEEKKP